MHIMFKVLCISSFHSHSHLGSRFCYSLDDLCPQNYDNMRKGHPVQTGVLLGWGSSLGKFAQER